MPFARWETFEACIAEQVKTGHDTESAQKICGSIQERAEKGALLKGQEDHLDVLYKQDGDLVVGGYASWELRDPQNDVITTRAQVNFLQKFFHEPEHFRNIMVKHGNFQVGTPLLSYQDASGKTHYSHVNEAGTYLVSQIRNNTWRSVQKIRKDVLDGKLKMYSISGDPILFETKMEHGEPVRYIYDIDPWEVTLCERGVNPRTQVKVLSKAEQLCKPCVENWTAFYLEKGRSESDARMLAEKLVIRKYEGAAERNECDTSVCKGVCCTFVTEWSSRSDPDLKKYLQLHGVETKDGKGGMWLKYPVVCNNFDAETYECVDWENRPDICRQYPRRESPFIPVETCSLLQKKQGTLHKSVKPITDLPVVKHENMYEEIFNRNWRKYMK